MSAEPRQDRTLIATIDPYDTYYPRYRSNGDFRRASRKQPCRICGHPDWCREFADGAIECMRAESATPTRNGGWLHWPAGDPRADDWRDRITPAIRPVGTSQRSTRVDAATRDRVYRRLGELCRLTDRHRDDLQRRGASDLRITTAGYGSLPATGRRAIAETLLAEFGPTIMEHIAGFYYRRDNTGTRYPTIAGKAGLLIPIRDVDGRIVGYQIRVDDPGSGSRYQWLSSKDREGGTGSGAPVHVARPIAEPIEPQSPVVITEGPLKADLSADELGCIVIAVPGVTVITGVLPVLKALNVPEAIIAYDMDAGEKPQVLRARDDLAALLLATSLDVDLATWDAAHKGLDDALLAGVEILVVPYPLQRRSGQLEWIPAAAVPQAPPRPIYTLAGAREARTRHYQSLITALEPGVTVDASSTGSGKTGTLARVLIDLHASESWPRVPTKTGDRQARVLYVAPTTEAASAFRDMSGGLAMLVEGRNPDPKSWWNCVRPGLIEALGNARALPMVDACMTCKEEHEALHGYWSCGYLEMKRLAEERKLIAAPLASFFNGSTELRKFDVVVVDESIVPALTETQTVLSAHVADWTERMNQIAAAEPMIARDGRRDPDEVRYSERHPLRRLVNLLGMLIEHRGRGDAWKPAIPVLREICPDLEDLVAQLVRIPPNGSSRRYPFETPQPIGYDGAGLFPLRLIRDLIEALEAEIDRPEGADTRLWLTADGLQLFMIRQQLVDLLRTKTVINLDATPNPLLRFLFPKSKTISFDAPAPTRVTQVKDLLATRRELSNARRFGRVQEVLEIATSDAVSPVIFTFKSLDPNTEGEGLRLSVTNPRAQYGHFDKETRALNRFADADVLTVVGHYSAPIHALRAEVQGLRFSPAPVAGDADDLLRLLPYQWRAEDGSGLGRWTRSNADPDLDAQIRWSESSTIQQAIGRGRAALRDEASPLEVLLITNVPIAGMPVDRLVTLEELGADPPQRTTPPGFYDQRDAQNAARASETRTKVVAAIAAMTAASEAITAAAVARRAGVRRQTISENATLRTLVDQAQPKAETVTQGVRASPVNIVYVTNQARTPHVTDPLPRWLPPDDPDITPVRDALSAADHARQRDDLRRANADLSARLVDMARTRGREPVPKPGAISPQTSPEVS